MFKNIKQKYIAKTYKAKWCILYLSWINITYLVMSDDGMKLWESGEAEEDVDNISG